jgi:hypothetical protein
LTSFLSTSPAACNGGRISISGSRGRR